MSETMYMTPVSDGIEITGSVASNKVTDPAFISAERNELATNTIEQHMLNDAQSYVTDLGYITDINKKLTLRDLGQHMTERMLRSMSQDNINSDFSSVGLGTPGESGNTDSNPLGNIFKSLFNEANPNDEKNFSDISEDPDVKDMYEAVKSRFGDYMNAIKDYKTYVENSRSLVMGKANVLNPPFMFNEIDDVRSDFRRPQLGRMYSEEIYDYNMPIVYFQPGIVSINTASIEFMSKIINNKTIQYQNYLRGDGGAIKWGASKIGTGINSILSFGAKTMLDKARWYKWIPNIKKYMKLVNEILMELAQWMGLIGGSYDNAANPILTDAVEQDIKDMANMEIDAKLDKNNTMKAEFDDNPDNPLIRDGNEGPLVVDEIGLTGKVEAHDGYIGGNSVLSAVRCLPIFHDIETQPKKVPGNTYDDNGSDDENSTSHKAIDYTEVAIPFAMDKGAQSSESFSNSTQTHPLVEMYNDQYNSTNQTNMTGIAGVTGKIEEGAQAVKSATVDYAGNKAKQMARNLAASVGFSTESGMIAAGLGRFVLPEVWTDSTFDKSYSISMKLHSPYGHRLSVYENEFVPLAFLIGLSSARKIGIQSYTNPFYVKMFAKGLFSVPMGMITSLNITRGEDNNDRTVEGFFRTISVNISIKDVLPSMAMGLGGGAMEILNASNTGMHNYILTLCGIDFIERANLLTIYKNKFNKIKQSLRAGDPIGFFGDAETGKANLMFAISNNPVGRTVSRMNKALGRTSKMTRDTPKRYY